MHMYATTCVYFVEIYKLYIYIYFAVIYGTILFYIVLQLYTL